MEILLVMDKKWLPLLSLRALLELGYVPVMAPGPGEAVRAFERQKFCAIIVDAAQPEFLGRELFRYFRAQDAKQPIILAGVDVHADHADLTRCDAHCRVVRRPLNERQLLATLTALNVNARAHSGQRLTSLRPMALDEH